ncbi:MAG: c-type cytochrome [Geobacteraceae bacterium]|nr:c-type cytochrome [Geobacteraceae bacterium]
MKGLASLSLALLAAVCLAQAGCGRGVESGKSGEELFLTHCSGCHPDGGNVKYPRKSLDRMTLAANGITTPAGIVAKMRRPGPGMKTFDRQTISDADARKVAEYILATFR